ncbi:MAG: hypothetical protein VX672_03160 [Planctomycetota bacterium]|nr:hypothetical protein [Planctomycetota bacterium]
MAMRSVHLRRGSGVCLALALLLVGGGCTTDDSSARRPDVSVPPEPRTVLVLPGGGQMVLEAETGFPSSLEPGRRDARLGGVPLRSQGPSTISVQIRDNQRVVNGRVRSHTSWRIWTSELRGQAR